MNNNLSQKKETKILHYFGIGAFFILTLFELCGFFGEILKDTFIVLDHNPKATYILSVLTSLVTFTIMLILLLKKIKHYSERKSRKLLMISIISLFITWILIACYDRFISDYLLTKFADNYKTYTDFWSDKYILLGYLGLVPTLYYIILGILVLKRE